MNFDLMNNNKVYIAGKMVSEPVFSHEIYGEGFYEFNLDVKRLSDFSDVIPVTISERLIKSSNLIVGSFIAGNGQFRSYNKLDNNRSKLMLTVFIRELVEYDENKNPNSIEIIGFVCKDPIYRTTPFKREICDALIAVNRSYNKSDYLPCIAWGRNARFVKDFAIGDKVEVVGRIQSRAYQKKQDDVVESKIAYEISLSKITMLENNECSYHVSQIDAENERELNYYTNA